MRPYTVLMRKVAGTTISLAAFAAGPLYFVWKSLDPLGRIITMFDSPAVSGRFLTWLGKHPDLAHVGPWVLTLAGLASLYAIHHDPLRAVFRRLGQSGYKGQAVEGVRAMGGYHYGMEALPPEERRRRDDILHKVWTQWSADHFNDPAPPPLQWFNQRISQMNESWSLYALPKIASQRPPGNAAVHMRNVHDSTMTNFTFVNTPIAMDIANSTGLKMDRFHFENVQFTGLPPIDLPT